MRLARTGSIPERTYYLKGHALQRASQEKDIGVIIDEDLSFDLHISEKVKTANSMFGRIRRTFQFLDGDMFSFLYKALVRSHLDYCSSVWAPYKIKHVVQIEQVQKRATKQLPGMKDLSYSERLQKLKLPTLSFRRLRGDLIEVFKIVNGIYDNETTQFLKMWADMADRNSNRGHALKLYPQQSSTLLRKNSFALRTVKFWNQLPEDIVSAPSVNSFKNRLDKHYKSSSIMYEEFKWTMTGSGNVSQ